MKKFMLSFLALCTLVSCSSGTSETPHISEPVEDIAEEPVFMEYNAEDFKEIDVKLNKQSGEPPVELKKYDISAAFEPVMSPCKENAEFHQQVQYAVSDDMTEEQKKHIEEMNEQQRKEELEQFNELCENPYRGEIRASDIGGGSFYFVVNYDNYCYDHCFKIWKFDLDTEETTLLYEHSDAEISRSIQEIKYVNGSLWLSADDNEAGGNTIYRLDEKKKVLESVVDPGSDGLISIGNSCNGKLIVTTLKNIDNSETYEYTAYEYDHDSEQWDEFYRGEGFIPLITENDIAVPEQNGNTMSVTVQDRFKLNTDLRSTSLVGVSEKRVSFLTTDSVSTILYTYDVEKMERYKIDLTGLGSYFTVYHMGENLFVTQLSGNLNMYLIPELGTAFEFESSLCGFDSNGSKIWTTNSQPQTEMQYSVMNGIYVHFNNNSNSNSNNDSVSELYVIE